MMNETIRVVLADDHGVVRRGIRDFLTESGDILVVAEAENGAQALQLIIQHQPEVAVLDVQMPNGSGIEVTRQIRAENIPVGVLILTAFDDPPYVKAALEAGANGYVLKSAQAEEIIEAVHAVNEGKRILDANIRRPELHPNDESLSALTDRELEVLRLAALGLTNKAIGFKLSISDRTVQSHLANIYEKLHVASRTEAVTRAVTARLIEIPFSAE